MAYVDGDRCDCPDGCCVRGVVPDTVCVYRGAGHLSVEFCERCQCGTWHSDGVCQRCNGIRLLRTNKGAKNANQHEY